MKNIALWLFNLTMFRIVFGIIIAGTIMSPWLNGFSEHVIWFTVGVLFALLVAWSIVFDFTFTDKNVWVCYLITWTFVAFLVYLFFAYGV